MKPLSLEQAGLTADQIQSLSGLGVATCRDLALTFFAPEQHSLLASLLGVNEPTAKQIVEQAATVIPPDELRQLVDESHRTHAFGCLPPEENLS